MIHPKVWTILTMFQLFDASTVFTRGEPQRPTPPAGKFFSSLFSHSGLFGHHQNKPNEPPPLVAGGGTLIDDIVEPVDPSNLVLVIVVTRHGSRAPTETYPNDPFPFTNKNYWPEGRGGLTRYGKFQMYRLGRNLRRRYSKYLSDLYRGDEVKVSSNPIERIFMSAQCLTTGLFPPVAHQIWSPSINWQPIPVYEDRFDVTKVISSSTLCPKAVQEENEAMKTLEQQHSSNFSDVFDILSRHSGDDVDSIGQTLGYYDVFQLQYENGLELPRWTRDVFPEPLTTMSAIGNQALTVGTPALIRLTAGPVLKSIYDKMKRRIEGHYGFARKKMFIEAAHDNTLIALFAGLGLTEPIYPGTSSHVIFELRRRRRSRRFNSDVESAHDVRVFYFNSSAVASTPKRLRVPNCQTEPCSLDDFGSMVKEINPENWDDECSL